MVSHAGHEGTEIEHFIGVGLQGRQIPRVGEGQGSAVDRQKVGWVVHEVRVLFSAHCGGQRLILIESRTHAQGGQADHQRAPVQGGL